MEGRGWLFSLGFYPPSDGTTIKIPYGVDVSLYQPASPPPPTLFLTGLVKYKSDFIVRLVETDLGR